MLYKGITGRLGNQMFQYAALRAYMEKYRSNDEMVLDFSWLENPSFQNDLVYFKTTPYRTDVMKPRMDLDQYLILKRINLTYKVLHKLFSNNPERLNKKMHIFDITHVKRFMRHGVYNIIQGYVDFTPSNKKTLYFRGNFESAKFFDDIRPIILEEFTPKEPELPANANLYRDIRQSESVCVSIRRGDFVENPQFKKHHYVCTPEYFNVAIQKMQSLVKTPKFFVFSDDIDWVKKNMSFPRGTQFETGNDPVWEKLRLMYNCKHFIISNSTFSWWAQYLSRNDSKLVIAPQRWKNYYHNEDIYGDSWILIDTESL